MYFLETIAGLKGENLTSAIIKYLLINSSLFRKLFHNRLVSAFSSAVLPEFRNGIQCITEESSKHGRVDLLIRSDWHRIVVENKIWADFQKEQLDNYWKYLVDQTVSQSDIKIEHCKIICIYPRDCHTKFDTHRQNMEHKEQVFPVIWEDILHDLQKLIESETNDNRTIAAILHEYVDNAIKRFNSFNVRPEQIVGNVALKNVYQVDLLYRLRQILDETTVGKDKIETMKMASGSTWYGFAFKSKHDKTGSNWFGFVNYQYGCKFEFHSGELHNEPTDNFSIWRRLQSSDRGGAGFDIPITQKVDHDFLQKQIEIYKTNIQPLRESLSEELA